MNKVCLSLTEVSWAKDYMAEIKNINAILKKLAKKTLVPTLRLTSQIEGNVPDTFCVDREFVADALERQKKFLLGKLDAMGIAFNDN